MRNLINANPKLRTPTPVKLNPHGDTYITDLQW